MSGLAGKTFYECGTVGQAAGAALTNTVTATSLLPPHARLLLPGDFWDRPGKRVILKVNGVISTVVTSPGNFTFDFRLGSVVAWNGGATALNIVAQTNASWSLEVELTCRAVGISTSANLIGMGKFISRASLNAPAVGTTTGVGTVLLPDTAPVVGTGFDSTASAVADLFGTWGTANAANSITLYQYSFESVN